MKTLLFIFTVVCLGASAQNSYKRSGNMLYNKTSVIVDSFRLQVGDTVYLGFGSGTNKKFVFINFRPNVWTYDVNRGPEPLTAFYAHGFMVLKELTIKKVFKQEYPDMLFTVNGSKLKVLPDLYNAYLSGEIKRFSSEKIDVSVIKIE